MQAIPNPTRWAVLVSLAAHGLLVLVLCLLPGGQEASRSTGPDAGCRGNILSAPDDPEPPGTDPDRAGQEAEEESDWAVEVDLGPAPGPEPPEAGPVPIVKLGPALPVGRGTGAAGPAAQGAAAGQPEPPGPGLGLLPVHPSAHSVVYLLDRSVSMGPEGALDTARAEVLASLRRLPATTRFQVIPYNQSAEPLYLGGHPDLLSPDAATLEQVAQLLNRLCPSGATDHGRALRRGLAFRPDVLYLATDAGDLSPAEVLAVTRLNQGRTTIHTVQLSRGPGPGAASLRQLAESNHGTYRQVPPGD